MNDSVASEHVTTPYEGFLAAGKDEPSAGEREQWAAQHTGDPEEPGALVDAGWCMARSRQTDEALELFRRAAEFGGEFGRDAQVGIVDQLYALEQGREAEAVQQALRAELDSQPGGLADMRIFADMVELLSEIGQHESALEWCQAGLDRATGADDDSQTYRHGLLINRSFLRRELGIALDDEDLAAESEADASLAAFGELVRRELGDLARPQGLDLPDDGEAFDGIVLRWVREDFTEVRSRWPESTAHYGDDYATYAARIQREARGYDEAGAARVHLVSATLADYKAYARREGLDPAAQPTRQNYGEWCVKTHPGHVTLWPPARNGPCWCDSGRKYKKCCGAPAMN
jgi:tetratricopeptide (TPR) repeat protein